MDEQSIEEGLAKIGLSRYEARCYLALLRQHPANPYQIAKTAGIAVSKIYEVVGRLVERGLIIEVTGGEGGYLPKPPENAIRDWKNEYESTLDELSSGLMSLGRIEIPSVIWNLSNFDEVKRRGAILISEARERVSMCATRPLYLAWEQVCAEAVERGVSMSLSVYGGPVSTDRLPVISIGGAGSSPRFDRASLVTADGSVALFAFDGGDSSSGAWTDNRAIARLMSDFIRDRIFLEEAIRENRVSWRLGVEEL